MLDSVEQLGVHKASRPDVQQRQLELCVATHPATLCPTPSTPQIATRSAVSAVLPPILASSSLQVADTSSNPKTASFRGLDWAYLRAPQPFFSSLLICRVRSACAGGCISCCVAHMVWSLNQDVVIMYGILSRGDHALKALEEESAGARDEKLEV